MRQNIAPGAHEHATACAVRPRECQLLPADREIATIRPHRTRQFATEPPRATPLHGPRSSPPAASSRAHALRPSTPPRSTSRTAHARSRRSARTATAPTAISSRASTSAAASSAARYTDNELAGIIANGIPNTAMPPSPNLNEEQVERVVAFLRANAEPRPATARTRRRRARPSAVRGQRRVHGLPSRRRPRLAHGPGPEPHRPRCGARSSSSNRCSSRTPKCRPTIASIAS